MRRTIIVGLAAALAAGLMLLPAGAPARSKHAHKSCPSNARVDRNHDGIPDRWECRHHLSLRVNQAKLDPDHDGLNNRGEFEAGDDPHKADTDNDGVNDGNEHAGTIQSFVADSGSPNTGTLTVALAGGGSVSGKVTSDTKCEVPTSTPTARKSDSGEHGDDHPGDRRHETTPRPGREHHGAEEPDGENNDGDHADGDERACTAADFTAGRKVKEADLKLVNGQAIFKEIELG
jgi:hypothetical protein